MCLVDTEYIITCHHLRQSTPQSWQTSSYLFVSLWARIPGSEPAQYRWHAPSLFVAINRQDGVTCVHIWKRPNCGQLNPGPPTHNINCCPRPFSVWEDQRTPSTSDWSSLSFPHPLPLLAHAAFVLKGYFIKIPPFLFLLFLLWNNDPSQKRETPLFIYNLGFPK